MVTLLTVIHIMVCLFLILVVLLQAGKGGGMGIAFGGGGGSQTVFGSSGAGNFLTRLTSITATIFLLTSLALAHYSSRQDSKRLQQLASEKAAEKKSEDEKAAKLKVDMEKIREAASKNGGAPGTATEAAPTTPASPPPLQLKMPGSSPALPAAPAGTDAPAKTKPAAAPATKKVGAAAPAGEGAAAPAAGDDAAKPVVKRRKPASVPVTGEAAAPPPPIESPPAPAPAAPTE